MIYEQQFIKSSKDGELIAYHEWYDEQAIKIGGCNCLVMMNHGYGDHMKRYEELAKNIIKNNRGAIVFGIDHPGHGLSGGEATLVKDYDSVVDDLYTAVQLVRENHKLNNNNNKNNTPLKFIIIGYSVGGMLTVMYYHKYGSINIDNNKIEGLVLVGPLIGTEHAVIKLQDIDAPPMVIRAEVYTTDKQAQLEMYDDPLYHLAPFKRETLLNVIDKLRDIKDQVNLDNVEVLWLHGEIDLLSHDLVRKGLDQIKTNQYESHLFNGVSHDLFHETNKEQVFEVLNQFNIKIMNNNK
ncbi:alpha/beta hydrolase fold protein [Heterostelium album PN500]|uniref:Alpha/beta hydrolase fold protein n=1 Tax=Heterostelium pallidum (strain ATCC 26659 / Pp 5 / PN500) TaxID=670386 RepID=D3BVE2_HETP5|nr:alpha/beta hydrolase fold protein [Heterostelium album PN500]EFA74699.1 alpha/beta hydrolase fold protein [Heterostelium album PN500]|eukprot:XP_020426833.1 alpha/beta hydrolase fold protein [Heterostelium album PN500]